MEVRSNSALPSQPVIVGVFVSSTSLDLKPEREAVEVALQRMRETKFVGMEHFGSRDENTREASLEEVDRCQVYVGIFAGRYGSGITEDEYRRARERKLPCFIYFKDESAIPRQDWHEGLEKSAHLADLKEELRTNHIIGPPFISPEDLAAKVTADLHRWLFDEYLAPQLKQAVDQANQTRIAGLTEATLDKESLCKALTERGITVDGDITESLLVLGNRNVINVLVQGVKKLPTDYANRIQNFLIEYLGTPEHPVPFGGREADIAHLDEWLVNSQAPPYLLLATPAGRGKSALLAHWSRHLLAKGETAVVFFPISVRFRTNLSSVIFAAITARLADIHNSTVPMYNTSAEEWRGLMIDHLVRPLPDGKQLVLIIDGADEAADWKFGADLFPFNPPKGLRIVLSTRHGAGDIATSSWLSTLGWDREHRAKTFELPPLSHEGIADVLRLMGFPLDVLGKRVDIVAQLHRLSEKGDPLLVRLYVDALWKNRETIALLQPQDLEKIPPGLKNYFEHYWWKHQRDLWGSQSPIREATVQAIFNILACAFGPVDRTDLLRLALTEAPLNTHSLDEALNAIQRFVVGSGHQQGYAFSHPRLGNYFYDKLSPEERRRYEERFLTWGQETVQALNEEQISPDSVASYILQYYSAHLERTQSQPPAFLALVSKGWKKAWENLEGSYTGFLSDVDCTWRVIEDADKKAAESNQRIPYIGDEVRCALCHTSVHSLAANLPPAFLVALVKNNILTPVQAWNYAHHTANQWQREETIVGLAPHLPDSLLVEAFEEARTIERSASRAEAFIALLPRLHEVFKEEVLQEALQAARVIANEFIRAETLTKIASYSSRSTLQELLKAADAIQDPFSQVVVLKGVIRHLPQETAGKVLHDALQTARTIDDSFSKTEALVSLTPLLPNGLKKKVLQESLDSIQDIGVDSFVAETLIGLSPYLTDTVAREALQIAKIDLDGNYLVQTVVSLSSIFPKKERKELIREAFQLAKAIPDKVHRAEAFTHFAPYLRETSLLLVLRAVFLNHVNRTIEYGNDAYNVLEGERTISKMAEALSKISPYLSLESKERVLNENLQQIRNIQDPIFRAQALTALAPYFPESLHGEVLLILQGIEHDGYRGRALASLAPYLGEPFLRQALQDAMTISDTFPRSEASRDLARHLTGKSRWHDINKLSPIVQPPRDAFLDNKAPAFIEDRSLKKSLPTQALQQALHEILRIKNACVRCRELVALLPHLPQNVGHELVRQELRRVHTLESPWSKVQVLECLAPCLSGSLLDDALKVAHKIEDNLYRAGALSLFVSLLPDPYKDHILNEILKILLTIKDGAIRFLQPAKSLETIVARLAQHIAIASLQDWFAVVNKFENPVLRVTITATLAPYLPEELKEKTLKEALQVARTIENEYGRASAFAELISHLPERQKEAILCEALQIAGKIEVEGFRVPVLVKLAPHLKKLPHHILYPVWRTTLQVLATRTRRAFVNDLAALSPVLLALGGSIAIEETIQAIEDVGQWWP